MKRTLEYHITDIDTGKSIGCFLRAKGFSRHILTSLRETPSSICLNGSPAFTNQILSPGDRVTILLAEENTSTTIRPIPMPLSILYEDEDLLIVNKPADTPIHPSFNNHENTLANGIVWHFSSQGIPFVYRCINRLDRDTTGLLIVAKHMLSAAILSQMVASREIHREYQAIVSGISPLEGTIDAPIARKEGSLLERCVDFENGVPAVTHYRRIACKDNCSLVSLQLETGRTHQIRVHMKYLGYPILGDYLYYPHTERMQRQALHSHCLEFSHPITGSSLCFTAPLPSDMAWIL